MFKICTALYMMKLTLKFKCELCDCICFITFQCFSQLTNSKYEFVCNIHVHVLHMNHPLVTDHERDTSDQKHFSGLRKHCIVFCFATPFLWIICCLACVCLQSIAILIWTFTWVENDLTVTSYESNLTVCIIMGNNGRKSQLFMWHSSVQRVDFELF